MIDRLKMRSKDIQSNGSAAALRRKQSLSVLSMQGTGHATSSYAQSPTPTTMMGGNNGWDDVRSHSRVKNLRRRSTGAM